MPELNWVGKDSVLNHHELVSVRTLDIDKEGHAPDKGNPKWKPSLDDNLIIKGDNLEALKALLPKYAGKVDVIYIDPPYNTGSENWVYNDKVNSPQMKEWLNKTVGKEDLQRHDKWLCMMYPRLQLLKQLLSEEGLVLISIDENEVHHLKALMNEVLGKENFSGEIVWKNSSKNDQNYISVQHEYLITYVKNKEKNLGEWLEKKESIEEIYKAFALFKQKHKTDWNKIHKEALSWFKQFTESNPISFSKHYNWMDENGIYFPSDISGPNYGQYRYDVIHPHTKKVCKPPASGWRYPQKTMIERIKNGLVHFGLDEKTVPKNKTYLHNTEYQSLTSIKYKDGRIASNKLNQILEGKFFENPKDHEFLRNLFKSVCSKNNALFLDSFAGSGTTGHAVLELNKEDGGNRKFILVQMEEATNQTAKEAGYETVDAITRERVKRVIKGVTSAKDKSIQQGLGGSFTSVSLGEVIDPVRILEGKTLPEKEALASHLYFTIEQQSLDLPKLGKMGLIGETDERRYYLHYEPDKNWFKSHKAFLTPEQLEAIAKDAKDKKAFVLAPACFVSPEDMPKNIVFQHLPYDVQRYAFETEE